MTAAGALAVALGAAAGALVRWGAGLWLNAVWLGFPLGTLAVNCAGGLLIGMCIVALEGRELARLLFVTGFLGGMTTFSAYSAESLMLLVRGQWALAAAHAFAHVLGALLCAALGLVLARAIFNA